VLPAAAEFLSENEFLYEIEFQCETELQAVVGFRSQLDLFLARHLHQ
jgi:hypothetical protein